MKPGGSRVKGARYEREIVQEIREAFGVEKHEVYRTPLSGGHYADRRHDPGDVQFAPWLREAFPFSIECKNTARASLAPLFRDHLGTSYWSAWIEQATNAAEGLRPCLAVKADRRNYAVIPVDDAIQECSIPSLWFSRDAELWRAVRFEDFLSEWRPRVLAARS